jgi:hypothetical protein
MPNATIVVEVDWAVFDGTSNFLFVTDPSINKFSFSS